MRFLVFLVWLMMVSESALAQDVRRVFGYPSTEPGYSLGVSAAYAGRIGDWLVVAGGCNFPSPGNKTYYRGIYAAHVNRDVLAWRLVGLLPETAAYGACVESGDSLVLIGGCNGEHALNSVLSLHLSVDGERACVRSLVPMPRTVDNMAVAHEGASVYVVGGNQDGKPSDDVLAWRLDGTSAWHVATCVPGRPRVQPVAAMNGGKVYVWGGFHADGDSSVVHVDGFAYDVASSSWQPVASPIAEVGGKRKATTLSGGVAAVVGGRIVCLGGVNHDIFLDAISGRYKLVAKGDYLSQPVAWYGFNPVCFVYDTVLDRWSSAMSDPILARAGAQMVVTSDDDIYYIGGELKPAVRTPQIVCLSGGQR